MRPGPDHSGDGPRTGVDVANRDPAVADTAPLIAVVNTNEV
jgi:hypothetical protein